MHYFTLTWTSCMSMTMPSSKSMVLYEPYLAEWPGESARPSPPMTRGCPFCWHRLTYSICWLFHTRAMEGNKMEDWWVAKVLREMVATPIHCRTRKTFAARAPENRMLADRARFPAGMVPMDGWLHHCQEYPQNIHSVTIRTMVPTTCCTSALANRWHILQQLNRSSSWASLTMNFLSSKGLCGTSPLR